MLPETARQPVPTAHRDQSSPEYPLNYCVASTSLQNQRLVVAVKAASQTGSYRDLISIVPSIIICKMQVTSLDKQRVYHVQVRMITNKSAN